MASYYFDPSASGSTGAGTISNPYTNQSQLAGMPRGVNNSLLFKRGTTWTPGLNGTNGSFASWLIPQDLFNYDNFVIDAYGAGAKPIIDGSINLTGWSATGTANVYQASMANSGAYFHRPGNLTQGGVVPTFVRWAGSLAASLAQSANTPLQVYDYNSQIWYLRTSLDPSSNPVRASYWRTIAENSTSVKRYGFQIKNIKVQSFSAYPWIFAGLDGMVMDGCEAFSIGGHYRLSSQGGPFYEGNFFDIRSGCDNAIVENCTIEKVFDSGVSPQFASQWGYAWTSLSNVTIRNNTFIDCGLAGVEIVIQQPTVDRITGVYIEGNTFTRCGKGPFGNASTAQGNGGAVNIGQNGSGGMSALSSDIFIRYNTINDSQVLGGDPKGPSKMYVIGNVCIMNPAVASASDKAVQMIYTVPSTLAGSMNIYVYGNVLVGYPAAVAVSSWSTNNGSLVGEVRYNTIVDCTTAFEGNSKANASYRISNNTLHDVTTGASGWGSSSFASQGGNRLSSVTTAGFTSVSPDEFGASTPSFADAVYTPVANSPLLSGGTASYVAYNDPLRISYSLNPGTRNAYTGGTTPVPPEETEDGLRQKGTPIQLSGLGASTTISLPSQPASGGTVIVAGTVWRFGDFATIISSITNPSAGALTVTQTESGNDDNTFTFIAREHNVTPGAPGPYTLTINFTTSGSNKISAIALEPATVTTAPFDESDTSSAGAASTSVTVGPTATLDTPNQFVLVVAGGLTDITEVGTPYTTAANLIFSTSNFPDDWTPGSWIGTKVVTNDTAQTQTINHSSGSSAAQIITLRRDVTGVSTTLITEGTDDEMQQIKVSETIAARRRIIFDAVDATDGFTPETGLTFSAGEIKISKNGAAEANHTGTITEVAGGTYYYDFALAETDTIGVLQFRTSKSGVRGARYRYQVVSFDPYNAASLGLTNVDATTSSRLASASYENTDAFLDKSNAIETGMTPRGALRLAMAAMAGKVSGAGTGTEVFRNAVADSKARITATVDTSGNRTSITTDQT
jgi:hypothetical protein